MVNPVLELSLYKGVWQLTTDDALYSFGNRYLPLVRAFATIGEDLPRVKNMLLLGTGLGSALHILDEKGCRPYSVLVELDEQVLSWAQELMPGSFHSRIEWVCADAALFVEKDLRRFDLVVVDVFLGRKAVLVNEDTFLTNCRNKVQNPGILVLNYMINEISDEAEFIRLRESLGAETSVIISGANRILILRV